MSVLKLIESIKKDSFFKLEIAEHRLIPSTKPSYRNITTINERLRYALREDGIKRFWTHQVEAIELIRQGENVVVMTPTASGKSLIYNIPVIESIMERPVTKALYIFPLKGLEQDQVSNLNKLFSRVGIAIRGGNNARLMLQPAEVYDGDTTPYRRGRIRKDLPSVIFTNPDMLHLAINPYHKRWENFFRNIRYVVIDEIHSYSGVFGSNVANILRRLRRICSYYGSQPQFIACSATIANPEELAEGLTGLPFKAVTESGAPQSVRHFLFINPIESPYTEATRLFVECLKAGLKTIVFTKARKITELIYLWSIKRAPSLAELISPYRAGFLPSERREIEKRLFRDEIMGVVSTSALELGVDIGGLDVCILVGYPGSIASTWQRAGRVGRHGQESAVFLIALQDALDQYFMRHPDRFFEKSHEAAVIDPMNKNILKKHLPCAASEVYLREDDGVYDLKQLRPLIDGMVEDGFLTPGKRGDIWFCKKHLPHRDGSIRTTGESFVIENGTGMKIGELSGFRVFREAFPGSIYLHRGKQYMVTDLDLKGKRVFCREVDVPYYTYALSREDTEIIEEKEIKRLKRFTIRWGEIRMTQRVIGYEKRGIFDRVRLSRHEISMPEYRFDTEGMWIRLDTILLQDLETPGFDLAGSLHATEHVTISCMPLFALCDKGDLGGLSYTVYPELGEPVIFIYDAHEGGVGLTKRVFDVVEDWFKVALRILKECHCEEGCPSCVQDPQCGSGNQPLDKNGARFILERWLTPL